MFLLNLPAGDVVVESCHMFFTKVELRKKREEEAANLNVKVEAMALYEHAIVLEAKTDASN